MRGWPKLRAGVAGSAMASFAFERLRPNQGTIFNVAFAAAAFLLSVWILPASVAARFNQASVGGITDIFRETMGSSLSMGQAALRKMGVRAHTAHRLAQRWPQHVYWIDVETRRRGVRVVLTAAPLDVGPALRKALFDVVGGNFEGVVHGGQHAIHGGGLTLLRARRSCRGGCRDGQEPLSTGHHDDRSSILGGAYHARVVHSRRQMPPADPHAAVRSEQVLARQLSASQQATMALGGAIGTGLFLASGLSVNVAGPAIILSYVVVAGVSLLLGRALTDMAVAHPTAGAFGVYAGLYVSPFAGYAVRVSYWLMQVIATGGQFVAASIYMDYWFPEAPGAVWVLAFAAALLYLNTRAVGRLGAVEYWLVMIKVVAIAVFVALAVLVVFGLTGEPAIGARHITGHGGFMPFGASGVWLGCCFAIYSFIGVEIVGVTSGEAADPARTIPAAMRLMVFGLSAIYVVTITLLVALTPARARSSGCWRAKAFPARRA